MADYSLDPGLGGETAISPSGGSLARQGIRSFFSFGVGLMLGALGLSALVSELSPLNFLQAGSVATLAAGAVLLIALVRAPRRRNSGSPTSNPGMGSQTG